MAISVPQKPLTVLKGDGALLARQLVVVKSDVAVRHAAYFNLFALIELINFVGLGPINKLELDPLV